MHPRKHGRVICQFVGTSLGEVLDMSGGGMRVTTYGDQPKVDNIVKMKLVGISALVQVRCRIAWVKDLSDRRTWTAKLCRLVAGGNYEIGLEFVDLTDEARKVITEIGAAAGKNETIRPDIERFRADAA